jgi:large subunit ribosomal protein L13
MGRRPPPAGIFHVMKTYSPKPRDIERRWYVLDASGAILGRLATQAATILRGKHKPIFAPHADTGDHVIVINAKEVTLSGGKENKKIAYHHSGYPGGLTETVYSQLLAKKPAFAVEKAIKGMLPHNRLGRQMASKLRVYAGADHRHEAQRPQALALGEFPTWSGLPGTATPEEPAPKTRPEPKAPAPARPTTAKRTAATPPTPKKTTSKRSSSKTTAKRTTATATTAKRSTAKSTAKSRAKKTTAKKTTAKRTTKKDT